MSERIVDACCTINLFASGQASEILAAGSAVHYVSDQVKSEALSIRQPDPHEPEKLLVQTISLTEACDAGWLHLCTLNGQDEYDQFVALAQRLDDGEASCLAIAQSRKWTVVTDDRKAINLCRELGITVITTPELVKRWAEDSGLDHEAVSEVIANIEKYASFRPGPKSDLYDWWMSFVD